MRKLGIICLFVVVILAFILVNGCINIDKGIDDSISLCFPTVDFISTDKENNTTTFNYKYNDLPFSITKETIIISDSDGDFETYTIKTDYLYKLFQYKRSLIYTLANNNGIGLYANEKDFLAEIDNSNPMVYYDLRGDKCYLYCFVNGMDDMNILFDFFGEVLVGINDYLPVSRNDICGLDIYLVMIDKTNIKESDIVQSKEFYMEVVELTNSVDNGLYRTAACNHYFGYIEDNGILD